MILLVFVANQHASGNAGAVKEPLRQADNGLDYVIIYEYFPYQFFLTAPKKHTVGHNGGHVAVTSETGQHVLHEHEIGFLASLGTPLPKTMGKFYAGPVVIL
jgi:hypothetical protein